MIRSGSGGLLGTGMGVLFLTFTLRLPVYIHFLHWNLHHNRETQDTVLPHIWHRLRQGGCPKGQGVSAGYQLRSEHTTYPSFCSKKPLLPQRCYLISYRSSCSDTDAMPPAGSTASCAMERGPCGQPCFQANIHRCREWLGGGPGKNCL